MTDVDDERKNRGGGDSGSSSRGADSHRSNESGERSSRPGRGLDPRDEGQQ
jgi:hypothetical protein